MELCDRCLGELAGELLPSDLAVLYALEGYVSMTNSLDREQLMEIVGNGTKYYRVAKTLERLEILGLVISAREGKRILYCLSRTGVKMVHMLLPEK